MPKVKGLALGLMSGPVLMPMAWVASLVAVAGLLGGCNLLSPRLKVDELTPALANPAPTLPNLPKVDTTAVAKLAGIMPAPIPNDLGQWVEVTGLPPTGRYDAATSTTWATGLGFTGLVPLLEQALQQNPSLAAAQARLKQAEAQQRGALANLFPTLGLNASAQRSRQAPGQMGPQAKANQENRFNAGASASWPIDFFGRTFSGLKVAAGLAASSRAQFTSTRLELQQAVAQTYFALLAATVAERSWQTAIIAAEEQNRLTQIRYAAGDLSLTQAQTTFATWQGLRVQAIDIARQRLALENRLNALLGQTPQTLTIAEADLTALQSPALTWPAELSATVVLQRPDVQAAVARLQAANAGIGLARAAFLPNISLVANGGFNTTDVDKLFNWGQNTWSIGPVLTLPIFQGGGLIANLQRSWGVYDEAVANYRGTVLGAYQELADDFATASAAQQIAASSAAAANAMARAETAQGQRYQAGDLAKADWLGAQILAAQAKVSQAQAQAANHAAAVAVLMALGGRWGSQEEPTQP